MASAGSRVLILVENLSAPFDQRVWREATALAERGYKVTVISPKGTGYDTARREIIDGIAVYRYSMFEARAGVLSYAIEYAHALVMMTLLAFVAFLREGFDVIQLCNPPDLLFLVALPYRLLGKKVIFDHHDLSPETFLTKGRRDAGGAVYRVLMALERLTFAFADVAIATNRFYRRIAVGRGRMRPERVFVVRNGPDMKRIYPVPEDRGLRGGRRHLVVYVGTMGSQDGVDYLLRSVRHLVRRAGRDDFQLLVVGGGPELEPLKRYCEELGIAAHVRFTGRVSDQKVREALSSADVCVCPDPVTPLNDVSTMNKTMEYMALGKPVVAYDLRETRSTAGEAALYAPANDEVAFAERIEALLDSPERRRRMGEIGRTRVRASLSWEHSKRRLWTAYEAALAAPRRFPV